MRTIKLVQRVVKEVEETFADSGCDNNKLWAVIRSNILPLGKPILLALCPTELLAKDVKEMVEQKIKDNKIKNISVYIREVGKKNIRL